MVTGDVTVSVTGTVALAAVEPSAVSVIVPLYDPGVNALPFAVTVTVAGVVPELGVMANQVAELVAVNMVLPPPELTASDCPAGAAAPWTWVKVKDVGDAAKAAVWVMVNVTGTSTADGNPDD